MDFSTLTKTFSSLEATSKRLEKTHLICEVLQIPNIDVEKTLLLLQGIVFPVYSEFKLGIATKTLLKTISSAYGVAEKEVQETVDTLGDVGDTAKHISAKKTQTTLAAFAQKRTLTVDKVFSNLQKIATETGDASTNRKIALIKELLSDAEPEEAKYIIRLAAGDLRIGISTGTIRDAIQKAFLPTITNLLDKEEQKKISGKHVSYNDAITASSKTVLTAESYEEARKIYVAYSSFLQQALDKINDMSKVAKIAKNDGVKGLQDVTVKPLIPCRVMLMQKVESVEKGTEKIELPFGVEYKYDGFRAIAHKKGDEIRLFTRSLENVTAQFPEVVESLQKDILAKEAIIDGEILGLAKDGSYVPFQEVSQRIKRKHNIHELIKKLPVAYVTWDIIYKDGKELLQRPMKDRRELLKNTIKEDDHFHVSTQKVITSVKEGEDFYKESLANGNEGVVLKDLSATYQPGNRVGCWLKLKPIMDPLDVAVVGAEWGEGKRASWLTSFIIAIKKEEDLVTIGKVGTGFKELEQETGITFSQMTELLKPVITKNEKGIVTVDPKIVLSVKYEEIQKSTSYTSGFALRFPRVLDLREDLDLHEIDDLTKVKEYYESQKSS